LNRKGDQKCAKDILNRMKLNVPIFSLVKINILFLFLYEIYIFEEKKQQKTVNGSIFSKFDNF